MRWAAHSDEVVMIGQLGFFFDGRTLFCRAFLSNRDSSKQTYDERQAQRARQKRIERARLKA